VFLKRLKYSIIFIVVFLLLLRLFIVFIRLPYYTIQTTGKLYVVNKISRDIQVFNLANGEEIAEIPIDMESHEATSTIDQNRVIVTNYGTINRDGNLIKTINVKTNQVEKIINLKQDLSSNGVVALPDPNKVVLIDYSCNALCVLNVETDSIEKQIETNQKKSHLVVMHPNKPIAFVTNINSGSVSVIDLNKNEVIKTIACGLGKKGIDITPDGSEIWVSSVKENLIRIINTSTYKVNNILISGKEPLKLKFSVDGKYCLVANATDGSISVYNQQLKKKIKTITLHGKTTLMERILYHTPRPVNILMHPNGLYAFVSNSNANKVEVFDMKTFKIVSTIGTGNVPDALVFIE
jgi:YVTN family beta-propeller protein